MAVASLQRVLCKDCKIVPLENFYVMADPIHCNPLHEQGGRPSVIS